MAKTIDNKINVMKEMLLALKSCPNCHQILKKEILSLRNIPAKEIVYEEKPLLHPEQPSTYPIRYVKETSRWTCACGSVIEVYEIPNKEDMRTLISFTAQAQIERQRYGNINNRKFPG